MKIYAIMFFWSFMLSDVCSQQTKFEFNFNKLKKSGIQNVLQTIEGNYIISVYSTKDSFGINTAYTLMLDSNGFLIKNVNLSLTKFNTLPFKIIEFDKNIIILNYVYNTFTNKYYFKIQLFDKNLNLQKEKNFILQHAPIIIDAHITTDSSIVIGGSMQQDSSLLSPRLFGFKVDKYLDSVTFKRYLYKPQSFDDVRKLPNVGFFNTVLSQKDSARYIFFDEFKMTLTDTNFNIISFQPIPLSKDCPCPLPVTFFSYSPQTTVLRINDSLYYVGGGGSEGRKNGLFILKTSLNGNRIAFKSFIDSEFNQSKTPIKSIDTTTLGFIYLGGNFNVYSENINCATDPTCSDTSQFILYKLDKNFNVIWIKRYGKSAFHYMNGLIATKDGGCLMYGYRSVLNLDRRIEAYAIKIDENGLMTNETAIPFNFPIIKLSPNPGTEMVQANFGNNTKQLNFIFYNMEGKIKKQIQTSEMNPLLYLADLEKGVYFFNVFEGKSIIGNGKWVKL